MEIAIGRRNEHGEYVVKVKGCPEADYFTDTIEDARATARAGALDAARNGECALVKDRSRVKGAEDYVIAPKVDASHSFPDDGGR